MSASFPCYAANDADALIECDVRSWPTAGIGLAPETFGKASEPTNAASRPPTESGLCTPLPCRAIGSEVVFAVSAEPHIRSCFRSVCILLGGGLPNS
jgi:hypothetical protein